jgi:hypothetical protein
MVPISIVATPTMSQKAKVDQIMSLLSSLAIEQKGKGKAAKAAPAPAPSKFKPAVQDEQKAKPKSRAKAAPTEDEPIPAGAIVTNVVRENGKFVIEKKFKNGSVHKTVVSPGQLAKFTSGASGR